jgi:peptidyl-dipeptidase Dcp
LLDRYYTDFVRAGAKLSDSDKAKLKAINAQLASLGTKFSQNVLKETNASAVIVEHKEQLKGLSEGEINTAAAAAKAKGLDGKYLIPLMNTSGQPYLASLEDRSVRQRLQKASVNRGSHGGDFDNRDTALQLARLRAERAQLLGYPNYAAYGLEDETAKTTTAVNKMLSELAPAAVANAKNEAAELQKIIDANHGDFKLAAWDWAYYTEQLRTAKYAFDDTQLRPYYLNSTAYYKMACFLPRISCTVSASKNVKIYLSITPASECLKYSMPMVNRWHCLLPICTPVTANVAAHG